MMVTPSMLLLQPQVQSMARRREDNVNPPFNIIRHEPPEVTKAKAYAYHRAAGSMEDYYTLYPGDRPPGRGSRDEGRGR